MTGTAGASGAASGVQSLTRAFLLLERIADAGRPVTLSALAAETGLATPTVHRLMRTLQESGYVRQDALRRYGLGPGLLRLGDAANRMVASWAVPHLQDLVAQVGETANLAMLDRDHVVYLAQVPSPHSMRMFTEVGRRVLPHCTGVGKALLAGLTAPEVDDIVARTGLPARTPRTLTTRRALRRELELIRGRGYAVDDGEQEVGVRCVAVALAGGRPPLALSVSGPSGRLTDDRVPAISAVLRTVARDLDDRLRSA